MYFGGDYILLLIRQENPRILLKKRQLAILTTVAVAVLISLSTVYSNQEISEAYAGETLSRDNAAQSIQVRVNPIGTNLEQTYDSFSRIGFVSGESNFLLESVPSLDKKSFYTLVKKSLESDNVYKTDDLMNISIDIYSGNGEKIHTLVYSQCDVTEYFVHGVDSRGKIFFVENQGEVEIREVTKFECVSMSLDVELTEMEIDEIIESIDIIDQNPFELANMEAFFSKQPLNGTEGQLFYNSDTNTLQKFIDGKWVNISEKGGPPTPRR